MKFEVTRTSNYDKEPFPGATKVPYSWEVPKLNEKIDSFYYTVELNSLEEFLKFLDEHRRIVLFKNTPDFNRPDPQPLYEIEIYDDYRE